MDNIPERETNEEPRRGVAPFAGGIENQGKDSWVTYIKYKDFSLGDVGKYHMYLSRPHNETLKDTTNKDDRALTIDLAGRLQRGNLRDFLRRGYYEVSLQEQPYPSDIDELDDEIKINLWVDKSQAIISCDLIGGYPRGTSFLIKSNEKNDLEHFVLPNNPEILQAVRINVSSK